MGISGAATTFDVTSGDGAEFPSTYNYHMVIDRTEIVRVTNRSTDTFTCVRAQEGTSPVSHLAGVQIQLAMTAEYLTEVQDADGPLIDATTALYGSGMAFGHSHGNANLPLAHDIAASLGAVLNYVILDAWQVDEVDWDHVAKASG